MQNFEPYADIDTLIHTWNLEVFTQKTFETERSLSCLVFRGYVGGIEPLRVSKFRIIKANEVRIVRPGRSSPWKSAFDPKDCGWILWGASRSGLMYRMYRLMGWSLKSWWWVNLNCLQQINIALVSVNVLHDMYGRYSFDDELFFQQLICEEWKLQPFLVGGVNMSLMGDLLSSPLASSAYNSISMVQSTAFMTVEQGP